MSSRNVNVIIIIIIIIFIFFFTFQALEAIDEVGDILQLKYSKQKHKK